MERVLYARPDDDERDSRIEEHREEVRGGLLKDRDSADYSAIPCNRSLRNLQWYLSTGMAANSGRSGFVYTQQQELKIISRKGLLEMIAYLKCTNS